MKEVILEVLARVNDIIWVPLMIMLMGTGFYFTYKLKFVQFKMLPESIRVMLKKEKNISNGINPVEAFLVGLASRIGAGNITGVATAIVIGGPGSMFWMWAVALVVAASSFVENTLGQIFKVNEEEKGFVGGPSYYMKSGMGAKNMGKIFAFVLIACYGIAFVSIQSNTISSIATSTFPNVNNMEIIVGIVVMTLTAFVLLGGAKKIVKVSSIFVPFMSVGYLILAVIVIILNFNTLPTVISTIISQAFTIQSITGATIGGVIINGARRGMFSNEAGMGSAPNAAATATTSHPVKQGLVQMLGVFVDTLVICTATGLIILTSLSRTEFLNFSNAALTDSSFNAVVVTQQALINTLGNWSGYLLAIFIFFFAFTSILGNYFYSESSFEYLTDNKKSLFGFKVLVVLVVYWGAVAQTETLWALSDVLMGVMAFLNIIAISYLFKYVYRALEDYNKQKKQNKDPIFLEKNIKGLEGTVWTSKEEIFNLKNN